MNNVFDLKLGSFEQSYRVYETSAPIRYDGFGTISMHFGVTPRWVLIRHEHEKWQVARYASGLFTPSQVDLDGGTVSWITEELHKRLIGKNEL
jgi:hypothetical protein